MFPLRAVLEPARLPALPLARPATTRRAPTSTARRTRCTASAGSGRGTSSPRARSSSCSSCAHPGDADWPFAFDGAPVLRARRRRRSAPRLQLTNDARRRAAGRPRLASVLRQAARAAACTSSCRTAGTPTRPCCRRARSRSTASTATSSHLDFDNCFEGWRGPARIRDERFSLQLVVVAALPRRLHAARARLLLRRAGQPRQQRDPHGRAGGARPGRARAGRDARGLAEARRRRALSCGVGAARARAARSGASRRSPSR